MAEGKKAKLGGACDVVVIGAGNGGLAAALALAVRGAKPLVLEQHNAPGGFATSFVRGRFEFEAALHELSSIGPENNKGGVRRFLEDEGGVDIDWVPIPEAYRVILTDSGMDARLPFGEAPFIDAIEEKVPGSREPLTRYFALCREVSGALGLLAKTASNPSPKRIMKDLKKFVAESADPFDDARRNASNVVTFLRTLPKTVDEVTLKMGIPPKAVDLLYPYWCYLGIPMSRMNFTIWAAMLIDYIDYGAWIPRLRSQEMSCAIEARVRELGGRVEYNTRVDRVLVERGRVKGVVTASGETIKTSAVIANTSPTQLYGSLVSPASEAPAAALRNVNSRKLGGAGFVVYLGLDASPVELGVNDYGYFISKTMDTDAVYGSMEKLDLVDMQATICLNNAIPDCSPPGTTIISMTTLYKPGVWDAVKPKEYAALKNRLADAMISQFDDALGTDIRSRVEEIEVATPATFARYARSFNGGIYGYELDPWDSIIPRILSEKDESYIKGLEVAGGFATMGHGFSSSLISGRSAGLKTLAGLGG